MSTLSPAVVSPTGGKVIVSVYWREMLSIRSQDEWGLVLGWRSDNLVIASKLCPTNDTSNGVDTFRKHFLLMNDPSDATRSSTESLGSSESVATIGSSTDSLNDKLVLVPVGFYCHKSLGKDKLQYNVAQYLKAIMQTNDIADVTAKNSLYTAFYIESDIPLPLGDLQLVNADSPLISVSPCDHIVVIYPFLHKMQSLSCDATIVDIQTDSVESDDNRLGESVSKHLTSRVAGNIGTHSFAMFWILTILNQVNHVTYINETLIIEAFMDKAFYFFTSTTLITTLTNVLKILMRGILRVMNYTVMSPVFINKIRSLIFYNLKAEVLEYKSPLGFHKVKNLSMAAQQLSLRLEQLLAWPHELEKWNSTKEKLSRKAQKQYIGFYNFIWLLINDVIFGITFGHFMIQNNEIISKILGNAITNVGINYMRGMVVWLMGYPAGLKLNSELTTLFGQIFLYLIDLWAEYAKNLVLMFPMIITIIGCSGMFGLSMIIALLTDLISLGTMHLHLFYIVAYEIYALQISAMLSLINLFTGKRRNVEKNRLDIVEYDLDQLLLGTVSFTMLVFLYPTTAVYYLLFTISRIMLVSTQFVAEALLRIVNHFPLFSLLLYIKDPKRLPGGIIFEMIPNSSWKTKFAAPEVRDMMKINPDISYVILKSKSLSLSEIFYQYRHVLRTLVRTYFATNILADIICGRPIKRVPDIEYEMLPH